jgi:hypothetical protein
VDGDSIIKCQEEEPPDAVQEPSLREEENTVSKGVQDGGSDDKLHPFIFIVF